jgi:hypothetical protein
LVTRLTRRNQAKVRDLGMERDRPFVYCVGN